MKLNSLFALILGLTLSVGLAPLNAAEGNIPILLSADLFQPDVDYGERYTLACLFAIREFDIKGVILNQGALQEKQPGRIPIEQMISITGRTVPYAVGLSRPLSSRTDKALAEPEKFQGGVELILSALRNSKEKVVYFAIGNCRDLVAAYNREPELLKEKLKAVYIYSGFLQADGNLRPECDIVFDPFTYYRIPEMGLPLYWSPGSGADGRFSSYKVDPAAVILETCTQPVQNYMVYALAEKQETEKFGDPVAFLNSGSHRMVNHPMKNRGRFMWGTAEMFRIAGRNIYQRGENDFSAMSLADAQWQWLDRYATDAYRYVPARITLTESETSITTNATNPNVFIFQQTDIERYNTIMNSSFKNLLAGLGRETAATVKPK